MPPDAGRCALLMTAARLSALAGLAAAGASASAARGDGRYPFALGVASGSPLPDAVVIWTRILHDPLNAQATPPIALPVRWEMAADDRFRTIVAQGAAMALPELAHSVHVDVRGLQPARWYWYRFMTGDAVSPVGRTRTAPAVHDLPAALKLAVASCQHWEFGTYAAHRHIASAARQRLYDTLRASGAGNPLVLSGDGHTFYAAELWPDPRQPASAGNPLLATEFCGTSVTSTSRPQARTQQYVDMNAELKYGRSDKRGFMLLDVRPERCVVDFRALDEVQDADSGIATLASFTVVEGKAGVA